MTNIKRIALSLPVAVGLSACSSTSDLRTEISATQSRLDILETEIAEGTEEIGTPGQDVRTRIAYRPFQQWASNFGQRTITFRQTSKGGDLARQSRRCRVFGSIRPGYRVAIHEEDSTRVDYTIGPLTLLPDDTGFVLQSEMDLRARTQIAGSARRPCWGGWSPTVTLGVSGRSSPTVRLRLEVDPHHSGVNPQYRLAIISPRELDVELRTGFQLPFGADVDVRTTLRMDNFAQHLASGELDLLLENTGEIVLPNGSTRTYSLQTIEPTLATDASGISFASDIELTREPSSSQPNEATED
ncbi:hypothetical protein [Aurantiacibacter gangjinensis]|nr:hypothetical protein [Aurantiacibacter gangjinensis]